jgi:hypothetical protein
MDGQPGRVVTLRPSSRRTLLLLAGSVTFNAITVWMIVSGRTDLTAWLSGVFFGACTLVFLTRLLPNSLSLVLRPEAFTVRSLFRESTVHWRDVEEFGVYRIHGQAYVGWNGTHVPAQPGPLRRLNRAIAGYESGLPDTFGVRAEDLVVLMDTWRERAHQ